MSKGKAVISSNIGGPLDIIEDEETGLLVAPGDVDGLAAAMQRLIDAPALRDMFGNAGLARVKRLFIIEAVVPQYENFYIQAISRERVVPLRKLRQWIRAHWLFLSNTIALVGTTAVTSGLGFAYWFVAAHYFSEEVVGFEISGDFCNDFAWIPGNRGTRHHADWGTTTSCQ